MKELSASEYVFLKWLQDTHPALYQAAEERQKSLGGFMDSLSTVFTNIANAAPGLLNQYVKGKQELEILKANLARAKAGEVPVDAAGQPYFAGNAPRQDFLSSVPGWAWAMLGIGAVYLLTRK